MVWIFLFALAVLGSLDSTALMLGNRNSFGSGKANPLLWAVVNAAAHMGVKVLSAIIMAIGPLYLHLCGAVLAGVVLVEAAHSLLNERENISGWRLFFPGIALGLMDAVPYGFVKFAAVKGPSLESLIFGGAILFAMPLIFFYVKELHGFEQEARWCHFLVFAFVTPLLWLRLISPETATPLSVGFSLSALAVMSWKKRRPH